MTPKRTPTLRLASGLAAALLTCGIAAAGPPQVFRPDDPVRVDRDDLPIPRPARVRIADYYDFAENTFFPRGERARKRAVNINTLGEVPDSSWYANRLSRAPMTREQLLRGPDTGEGPAPGNWVVVAGKAQGISPGFTIRDSRGHIYFLKFDPKENPELATSAEMISTKLLHAVGYNTPENYLVDLDPRTLTVDPQARVENELGEKEPLTLAQINSLLERVAHKPGGMIRTVASSLIEGTPVGPFRFYGTRRDDANDIFPHEHRRELRGYRVFCAWINHDDSRSINTLDVYRKSGEQGYLVHYLIDFGSTLGSGSVFAQRRRPGNEYMWEAGPSFATMFSMGLWLRPWVTVQYPDLPSVGRFESEFFRPEKWKPEYPNVAFDNMDGEDAFWAARQVMRFSDEDIREVVKAARLSDPKAGEYLVKCLVQRRDKTGDHWLRQVSSLDDFRVGRESVEFSDLLVTHGFARSTPPLTARFDAFDNRSGRRTPVAPERKLDGMQVRLPERISNSSEGDLFVVSLDSGNHGVELFLRNRSGSLTLVGLERR